MVSVRRLLMCAFIVFVVDCRYKTIDELGLL